MSQHGWRPYGPPGGPPYGQPPYGQQPYAQPAFGAQPYGAQPYGQSSMMRASDADRERASDVLKAGFAEGRLSQDELDARLTRVQEAVTYGELQAVVADLPQGPVPQPQPQPSTQLQPYVPPPPPMAYQRPYKPYPLVVPPPTNGNATASLICGLLTPVTWGLTAIPAIVLGHKARTEIRQRHEQGDGQALTGLIFGYLGIVGWIVLILAIVVAVSSS
ncbi:DUF1707 and DUF4190 domain-containing protein [Streptomyces sp. 4N509B]|uniref:DUF1707 and DUF4190 domain-containing protein n=1 Tax=Streptomyces sp. 4N509B TaxID=3457413 RepID=UPI003FD35F3D